MKNFAKITIVSSLCCIATSNLYQQDTNKIENDLKQSIGYLESNTEFSSTKNSIENHPLFKCPKPASPPPLLKVKTSILADDPPKPSGPPPPPPPPPKNS
jgi:hypothetical protein